MNLKSMDKETMIVFDTNVYLGLYRFSVNYSLFVLNSMINLKSNIIIPSTIYIEFCRHNDEFYKDLKNVNKSYLDESIKMLEKQRKAELNNLKRLENGSYPDVDTLKLNINHKYDDLIQILEDYSVEHDILNITKEVWEDDYARNLMDDFKASNKVLPFLSLEEIYDLSEIAENRYEKKIPPGYKDAKDKRGFRKYSDYFWWYEILRYAKNNRKNIIIVSDDQKEDWIDSATDSIREELRTEFEKETQFKDINNNEIHSTITLCSSKMFFTEYATQNSIEIPDAIDVFLSITDDEYIKDISNEIFDEIVDDLSYSQDEYLDISSFEHIGDYEIESWDINEHEFLSFTCERVGKIMNYELSFKVYMATNSYDYWGRDDDTKEVMLSNSYEHEVEGTIVVGFSRELCFDSNANFESSKDNVKIIYAKFKEISHRNNNYDDDEIYGNQNTCPRCGKPLTFEDDGLNGFCKYCDPDGETDD